MTYLLEHDSIINHSGVYVLHNNILNEVIIWAATVLTNDNIFKHEYIMQLNDAVAMTMLQSKLVGV